MSITSRILPKLPSLQTSIYERFVFDEKGLRAVLLDIAANPTSSKTIRVVGLISLGRPLLINSSHSGVHISGVGVSSGITNGQPNTTLSSIITASGSIINFSLERLNIGVDNRASGAQVVKALDFSLANIDNLSITNCVILATTCMDFGGGVGLHIQGCRLFGITLLTSVSDCVITGGILGVVTATTVDGLVIGGAVIDRPINTAGGASGSATIVGNDFRGNFAASVFRAGDIAPATVNRA